MVPDTPVFKILLKTLWKYDNHYLWFKFQFTANFLYQELVLVLHAPTLKS